MLMFVEDSLVLLFYERKGGLVIKKPLYIKAKGPSGKLDGEVSSLLGPMTM